jgi:hypothetical protein
MAAANQTKRRQGKQVEQLLAHLCGDWMTQNNWIALNKRTSPSWLPVLVHGMFYGLSFVVTSLAFDSPEMRSLMPLAFIVSTHILVDRFNVASLWVRAYNWQWDGDRPNVPNFVLLCCDQSIHLWLNAIALHYLS